jgi:hypothetical protein
MVMARPSIVTVLRETVVAVTEPPPRRLISSRDGPSASPSMRLLDAIP